MGHRKKKNERRDNRDTVFSKEMSRGVTVTAGMRSPHTYYTVPAVCIFLLLAIAVVFGQTIGHQFVNYDDGQYVYENPQVADRLTIHSIAWAFTTMHASNWHPLTWLSHMLDYRLYGLHAGGHHLTSVLLHAVAAILLFLVLWRMTGNLWPSAFVAAIFAIHPLRVESVSWVAERKDVLSGLFFMLTLWAYVGYARRPFSMGPYLTVVLLFALGLMAKPMLVTLPFVLLLLDYWPLERIGLHSKSASFSIPRRVVIEKLPLLALTAVSCMATLIAQGETVVSIEAAPLSSRFVNALVSYVAYIGDLFYPVGLAVLYPYQGGNLPVWKVVAAALAFSCISVAALAWRRRFPYLFVGWFWYVGMLVPVIGLVQVGSHSMADRYTYLPQIGLCLFLTWGAAQLVATWRYRYWVCGLTGALVVLVLMGMAWRQTSYWRDSEALWTRASACTARNYIAHYNLGKALLDRGQVDAAIAHYQKALEIKPDSVEALIGLGKALSDRGQVDAAIAHYQKALEIKPEDALVYNNLGLIFAGRRQSDEAIIHFRKALELKPDYASAHQNLGVVLTIQGRLEESIEHYRRALELKPDFPAITRNNLGIALARTGKIEAAIEQFRMALGLKPDYVEARTNLENALRMQRQTK